MADSSPGFMIYPASRTYPGRVEKETSSERGVRLAVVLFFVLYLAAGVIVSSDYGASWDEPLNRDLGQTSLAYLLATISGQHIPWAEVSQGLIAEQGPLFEILLSALEKAFGLEEIREILLLRHLATFLAYWLGTIAFYALLHRRFADRKIALAGVVLLVLTPRLFAHSFYNSKDAVLAALFMIGMLTMINFVRQQSAATALIHGLVCAAAVAVRVVGLLLPFVTLLAVALSFAGLNKRAGTGKRALAAVAGYIVLLLAAVYLFWPALWEHPVSALGATFHTLASARQLDNNYSLYLGNFVRVDQLPWHYLPVWMAITVPLTHLLLFAAGLWASGRSLVSIPLTAWENVQNIAFMLLFFVPVLAVVVMRPVLYDDWRHLYFVYPAFLVIGLTGFRELSNRSVFRNTAVVFMLVALLHGVITIVRYHPYQNVYFNFLAGKDVESRFELDYWGLSFREGLKYVLHHDPSNPVLVAVSDYPGEINSWLLTSAERGRLRIVPLSEADWFLSNHRQPEHFADFRARRYPCVKEAHAVRVNGATLLGVYRLR